VRGIVLEIEIKFPVSDLAALEARVMRLPISETSSVNEADHYFSAPDRDFARTDEALRVRRIGSKSLVTYKGPRSDKQTKTRKEIEVPLGDGDAAAEKFMEILTHLGYRPTAVVKKLRKIFRLERDRFQVEICLDTVEHLGQFAELEIVAPENRLDAARGTLLNLAQELGLNQPERRSYLELLLERQKGQTR
jgi:adenylate cyclase, class 2